jgi:restriction system protein
MKGQVPLGDGMSDRVFVVIGRSGYACESRQSNLETIRSIKERVGPQYDKGHFIPRSIGGGSQLNIFPQRRDLNRAWSNEGRCLRQMERHCHQNQNTLCFNRPIYLTESFYPSCFEFGLLKKDGNLWISRFDNQEVSVPGKDLKSDATLLVQAIVEPYGKTNEGDLVRAMVIPWRVIVNHLAKDWTMAFEIPPRTWEELIAAGFEQAGYDEVILTPRSGDHGRDVVAVRRGVGCVRIIGSVKAYAPHRLVKHDDVRALAGVLHGDHSATKGVITTTSDFAPGIVTDPYLAPLMPFRLELMNGQRLCEWLNSLTQNSNRQEARRIPK